MQVLLSLDEAKLQRAFLAIGTFDGVHNGHRQLLEQMVAAAHTADAPSVVLTFSPHPRLVLGKDPAFRYLTTIEERLALFDQLGLTATILQTFNADLARLSAANFTDGLVRSVGLQSLWVGDGFALGGGREGNISFLQGYGVRRGFSLHVVPPYSMDGEPVSSSRIRKALAAGDVETGAKWLGRRFGFTGEVVHGDGRGHQLGTPTANVVPPPQVMIPANGIYATRAMAGGVWRGSVTNVGVRPTFYNDNLTEPLVETYLFDFDGDLYGQSLRLEFTRRLRDEVRFKDRDALHTQIQADIRIARMIWEAER
jgi:riboflavin kinase / FMN adenylyltransferase